MIKQPEKPSREPSANSDDKDNSPPPASPSRRGFLAGAGIAAGASILPGQLRAHDDDSAERFRRSEKDKRRRILIKGGTILSMDPTVGDLVKGDVLIEGSKIKAIGANISASAETIDARGMIVIPGFCDPHIHSWQGQIPRIIPNQISVPATHPTNNYTAVMHQLMAPAYRPEDMYIGTLMTMLTCINGGITTVCDNSHNSRSSAHSDAAIRALFDSGVRGVHASGAPRFGTWDMQWPNDVYRLKKKWFSSDDQLVTLRLFVQGSQPASAQDPAVLKVRKDLDLWMSFDGGGNAANVPQLYADGVYNGKESYNHGGGFPEANMHAIVEHGAKVNVCPRIDSQFGGNSAAQFGFAAYQRWLDFGLRPAMSNDDPGTYSIDMFAEMHVLYASHRGKAKEARFDASVPDYADVTVREILQSATLMGAEGCALDHKVGSLRPGKEADIDQCQ